MCASFISKTCKKFQQIYLHIYTCKQVLTRHVSDVEKVDGFFLYRSLQSKRVNNFIAKKHLLSDLGARCHLNEVLNSNFHFFHSTKVEINCWFFSFAGTENETNFRNNDKEEHDTELKFAKDVTMGNNRAHKVRISIYPDLQMKNNNDGIDNDDPCTMLEDDGDGDGDGDNVDDDDESINDSFYSGNGVN